MWLERFDAFVGNGANGNTATVFRHAAQLGATVRQRLAEGAGAATSVFVGSSPEPRVYLHTPTHEIQGCGHAWLSAACSLAVKTRDVVALDVGHGHMLVSVHRVTPTTFVASSRFPRAGVDEAPAVQRLLARDRSVPAVLGAWIATGSLRHLMVELATAADVDAWSPSPAAMRRLGAAQPFDTLATFARGTESVRMRDFCLPVGDYEEAASGTTSAALASLLAHDQVEAITIRQGHASLRFGELHAEVCPDGVHVRGRFRRRGLGQAIAPELPAPSPPMLSWR